MTSQTLIFCARATPEDIRREFVERLKSGKWNHPHDYLGDYLGKDVEIIDDVGKRWTGHVALYEPAIDRDEDEPQEAGGQISGRFQYVRDFVDTGHEVVSSRSCGKFSRAKASPASGIRKHGNTREGLDSNKGTDRSAPIRGTPSFQMRGAHSKNKKPL